ncbi:hypothetical protein AB0L97_32880 [Nocardia sp. NPDC051911]|uniref:hypothetical protein n=1 Tax=Nocardia sp. NPDC051911 TaxID=3154648 RepID=UPI003428DC54
MSDIVAEIDRVLAAEIVERKLDQIMDLARAANIRMVPWQQRYLQLQLQGGPYTLATLPWSWGAYRR